MTTLILSILSVPIIALVWFFIWPLTKAAVRKWCWEDESESWKAHNVRGNKEL